MKREHEKEMIRFAEAPEGTLVWQFFEDSNKWILVFPGWDKNNKYVVDDEWAELRKAQIDGKQLQRKDGVGDVGQQRWRDDSLSGMDQSEYVSKPTDWRVKPNVPKYEWQWMMRYQTGTYSLTTGFYPTMEAAKKGREHVLSIEHEVLYRFEPSKREILL